MEIKVLGPGCKKCKQLEQAVRKAVAEVGLDATVEKITAVDEIAAHNVLLTPGLVINGKVKVSGRLPGHKDIVHYIREEI